MQNFGRKAMSNNSIRQFANRAGTLIAKNPFWTLVIGSLGIHLIFVLIPFTPAKKAVEPPPLIEVKTTTLPVVKLPPQSTSRSLNKDLANKLPRNTANPSNISTVSKSIFDSLFVQSSPNKLIIPSNIPQNTLPNSFSNSLPSSFELSSIERIDGLPPLMELPDVPLPSTNFEIDPSREFVKPRTSPPLGSQLGSQQSRTNAIGQIDNINPVKTATNSSNLRPEFQTNSGLRDTFGSQPSEPKSPKNPDLPQKNPQSSAPSNSPISQPVSPPINQPAIDPNIKSGKNLAEIYNDDRVTYLLSQELLENTKIVPNPKTAVEGLKIEDVDWIPPKGDFSGKSGTVIYVWLVAPNGKVEFQRYTIQGDKELVKIVADAAKGYQFKPNERSSKYRFVTAKYEFPVK